MMTGGLLSWEGATYPRLDLKAWNTRLMTAFFHVVLHRLQEPGRLPDGMDALLRKEIQLAFGITNAMVTFLDRMERASRYLTGDQANEMFDACTTFLSLNEILAKVSHDRGVPRWKIVPKHHSLKHLSEDQVRTHLNCRHFHCFIDEDFIGFWKRLVQASRKNSWSSGVSRDIS